MKNFLKGSAVLMTGDLITKVISVLYLIPLIRYDSLIGRLNANLLIPFGIILVLTTMGINIILVNEFSKYKNDPDDLKTSVYSSLSLLLITTIIATSIMFFFTEWIVGMTTSLNSPYFEVLVLGTKILSIGVVLFSINTFLRAILLALGNYKIVSVSYFLEQIIRISLLLTGSYFYIFIGENPVTAYVPILSISILISMVITTVFYTTVIIKNKIHLLIKKGKYKFSLEKYQYLLSASIVLFSASLFASIFDQIDLIMMKNMFEHLHLPEQEITEIQTEYFSTSLKLVMIPITVSVAFITVMISHLQNVNFKSKIEEFNKILDVGIIFGLISTSGLFFVGPILHELMYGFEATIIFQVQTFIIVFYIIRNLIGTYIVTNEGSGASIHLSTFIIVVTKVAFNYMFFSLFGIPGFSLASILAISISILILVSMNKKLFVLTNSEMKLKIHISIKYILSFGSSFLVLFFLYNLIGNLIIQVVVGTVITTLLFGVFLHKEIKLLLIDE